MLSRIFIELEYLNLVEGYPPQGSQNLLPMDDLYLLFKVRRQHFCIGPYFDNPPVVNQLSALLPYEVAVQVDCVLLVFVHRPTINVVSGRPDSNWNGRRHRGFTHLKYDSDDYSFIFGLAFENVPALP